MTVPRMRFWGVLLGLLLAGATAERAAAQAAVPAGPAAEQRGRAAVPAGPAAEAGPAGERVQAITLPVGGTYRLQSPFRNAQGQPTALRTVVNENENVLRVQALADDPTSVLLRGEARGTSRITVTDENNRRAVYDVVVAIDIQLLKRTIRQAVPTSNIEPILVGGNVIILTGSVERPEDIDTIMRTAQTLLGVILAVPVAQQPAAAGPGGPFVGTGPPAAAVLPGGSPQVINAMRVGGVMQVQLDVVVAEVSRTELRRMSFDFMNFGVQHVFASTPGGGFIVPSAGIGGSFPGAPTITNTVGAPNGQAANFFAAVFTPEQDFFGLLQLLRTEELAKVLTEPKLVTMSGRPATMLSGGQQAIPEPGGLGTTAVRFEPFGTSLTFLPIVLGNGKISLQVVPEVSTLNAAFGTSISGTIVPGRDVQRVQTTVEMEDGQTLAIGGMIQHAVTANTNKVPVLGDIPYLGVAFSSKFYNELETELVVLVTPHLIDPMSCDQVPKLLPGQETRSPDDFELFLEGILEAPRGPRAICQNGRYVPAYKNGPTSALYPCAGDTTGRCARGGNCGGGNCGGGNCGGGPVSAAVVGAPAGDDAAMRAAATPPMTQAPDASPPAAVASGGDGRPTALPPALLGPVGTDGQK